MTTRVPATAPPPAGDRGHLWTADEWQRVVAQAQREADRINRGAPALVRHGLTTGLVELSGSVVARMHGGSRPGPTFGVLHSAETPLAAGYAAAIARMFATTTQPKSCHYMTDPAETWGVLDDLLIAWHVGNGNPASIGLEQSGRASMIRAEWLAPAGHAQMTRNATIMRAARARFGIGCFWMTDQQIRDAHARRIIGGWCTHDDARRVLGGTTHTDPGPGFPRDVQMQLANEGAAPPVPVLPPAPPTTGESDVRLVKAVGTPGPVYLVTELELYATNDISLVDALARAHAVPLVDLHAQQIDLVRRDADRRRTALGLPAPARAGVYGPPLERDPAHPAPGSPEYLAVLDDVLEYSRTLLPHATASTR